MDDRSDTPPVLATPPASRALLRFGVFEVDPRSGELRKSGMKVRLQEKPFQLLLLLLERSGDVVTRDELRAALWPSDTFVDFDHSLGTAVAKLRSALGDSAKVPRFVETVASRGYRFIAPVTAVTSGAVSHVRAGQPADIGPAPPPAAPVDNPRAGRRPWRPALLAAVVVIMLAAIAFALDVGDARRWIGAHRAPVRSLAVLPLQNLSKDPSEEYFVDGMTEQLIATLTQLRGLEIISRTSAMQYKTTTKRVPEIARELNADAIIEGSVVRAGNRVRITAQLIDARTDQHVWAQSYERDFGDVLALQNEIAGAIANEIRIQLTPEEKSQLARAHVVLPAAQEAYLRGRYQLNKGDEADVRNAVQSFEQAIAADSGDARSYAGLAQAYIALTDFYDAPGETMPLARAAAETAIRLDESYADGHTALGAVRFLYDWDWRAAETEFRRAIALNNASADAHVWLGIFLAQMGRISEAIPQLTRAEALDPLSVPVRISAGWVYYLARRNDQAIAEWRKALELEPDLGVAHTSIWLAYAHDHTRGRGDPRVPGDPADTSPLNMATLAGAYAMSGDRGDAERLLARLKSLSATRYVCPYEIAVAHAVLDEKDQAIEWLRRGVRARSVCMPDVKVDPRLDGLRADPRFAELLRSIGFTP